MIALIRPLVLLVLLGLAGCLHITVQQGNMIDSTHVDAIALGDTRFRVETLLGTPVLNDVLHPNRATYVEYYEDKSGGKLPSRWVIIHYDESLRVSAIERHDKGGKLKSVDSK
ncbi:MAG: outer membrane protein assembly factor BamE [Mariprofundales bacterium]|nr:outer membrane protein assembly factor BamE [Mariprofundales bacterium]